MTPGGGGWTLTPRQQEVLDFIRAYIARTQGVGPTLGEIAAGMGLSSRGNIHAIVRALEERGHVARQPYRTRSFRLLEHNKNTGGSDG